MIQSTGPQDSTITETEYLLELARRLRAKRFAFSWKDGQSMSIEFEVNPPIISDKIQADSMPTEEELLYWSTNYDENIKAESPE